MENKKSLKGIVLQAISMLDSEFDAMGRIIPTPTTLDKYLVAATYKAIRLTNAINTLCDTGITDEALPVLRSLIEHTINMRWITNKDTSARLKEYMSDLGTGAFGKEWTNTNLLERMKDVGFKDRDYFDYCIKLTYAYSHINATALIWGEVYDDPRLSKEKFSTEAIYGVTAQMLGHVLKALNCRFTDHFSGYDTIWKQIKVDKNIRTKIELIKNNLDKNKVI